MVRLFLHYACGNFGLAPYISVFDICALVNYLKTYTYQRIQVVYLSELNILHKQKRKCFTYYSHKLIQQKKFLTSNNLTDAVVFQGAT
jgi:hypothetical protein